MASGPAKTTTDQLWLPVLTRGGESNCFPATLLGGRDASVQRSAWHVARALATAESHYRPLGGPLVKCGSQDHDKCGQVTLPTRRASISLLHFTGEDNNQQMT